MYGGRGRHWAVLQLKEWLSEHAPADEKKNETMFWVPQRERDRRLMRHEKDFKAWSELEQRMAAQWVDMVAAATSLKRTQVIAISNCLVDQMELALAKKEPIVIKHFGVIKQRGDRIVFKMDPVWELELNDPADANELGVYTRVNSNGRLERRSNMRLREPDVLTKRQSRHTRCGLRKLP